MSEVIHDLELPGCRSEPLMAYLKAIGILRLVSEQQDAAARGWWKNETFLLRSGLDRDALVKFFLEDYSPTPIVVPWSGSDFFGVNWNPTPARLAKTPTASKAIEAVLLTNTERLRCYREVLHACRKVMDECGISSKDLMGEKKWLLIERLRATSTEARLLDWLDAAAITGVEKFAPILGSGGGSDGNTHFSDNFIQNLWDVLPDFDDQRLLRTSSTPPGVAKASRRQLADALFAVASNDRVKKRTSALFDSGAVGGPNATQGFDRESQSNPWDVVLGLEGTVCFAGAAVRRLEATVPTKAAFPFQVSATITVRDRLAEKEGTGSEVWLPLWTRPCRSDEVLSFLREGRAQCGSRRATSGLDMARSVAALGVDRGIGEFHRYAIMKGRVGGPNYNTAVSLGRFEVVEHPDVDLLREADDWLDRYRSACAAKDAPARFGLHLNQIDTAIVEFCQYGGRPYFQQILVALGSAEGGLATAERFREKPGKKIKPLGGLSSNWLSAANDGSPEFDLALGLASIYDPQGKIGPFRTNLEAVDWKKQCRAWAEKERSVVWSGADLSTNLASVLQRRMMDGERAGCEHLPLESTFATPVETVATFIEGDLNNGQIENLLWGLILLDWRRRNGVTRVKPARMDEAPPIQRDYALLKLLFLPHALTFRRRGDGVEWRYARNGERGVAIRAEPRILPLLRAGRVGEACGLAASRLRVSGLPSMPRPFPDGRHRDDSWSERPSDLRRAKRMAAALLIPISSQSVDRLVHLVCREDPAVAEMLSRPDEGESA